MAQKKTAEKNIIVKFTRNYTVQDERVGTPDEESYKKGQRKSLPERSALHFIDRGAAVEVKRASK